MNDDDISVPDPIYMKWPENYSCPDSPTPILQIRYEGLPVDVHRTDKALITLTNKKQFIVLPNDYATINFNVLVTTSLPAVTILHGSDFLFRLGLTCVLNLIPTNDTFLSIKVYNHKSVPITCQKESLQFTGHTVLTKYP
jgi:hypothetical protein